MSESLKQKIQDRIIQLRGEVDGSTPLCNDFRIEELESVLGLLDETAEGFPYLKCREKKSDDVDGHCSNCNCEHYRCCNWFLVVFEGNDKEKAKL